MTFHFQCPYGHLLAGEESQAGQQCMCPVCTTLFIIPAPLAPACRACALASTAARNRGIDTRPAR